MTPAPDPRDSGPPPTPSEVGCLILCGVLAACLLGLIAWLNFGDQMVALGFEILIYLLT